ncbi:MAG TPA: T9SS type A sorting domain-containing protein [Candidatus Limnocylindrales bacterium]|nr:T9SS type A sorting domain-containing protein [Candidatus Limnocylindrales bacterium]
MRHPARIFHGRIASVTVLALLAAFPCRSWAIDCTRDSTGMIPLTDLGVGFYQGFQGGLYSGGSNQRPAAHAQAGLSIANSISPLDTLGNVTPAGRVVLISIGMSNATQEFQAFVPKAMADPLKKPEVLAVDCAVGGMSADRIDDSRAAYWDSVATRLRRAGSSPLQAQVVWLKEANATPHGAFPASAETLQWNLASVVRIIKQKLPNVRLCYFTSRIYAGYATTNLNPEPYAYESAFAVKWLIDSQIRGDSLNFDPARGTVDAPWLSWGPYLWADGLNPRSDGLTWPCSYFQSDGTHPATGARILVADSLLTFIEEDPTTVPWYGGGTVTAAPIEEAATLKTALTIAPNPSPGISRVLFAPGRGEVWRLEVFDLAGRLVREIGAGMGTGAREERRWDGRSTSGRRAPQGIYWIRLSAAGAHVSRRLVLLESR